MPLYGTRYIFSKEFFTGWVTVGIIWIFLSFIAVGIYPIWESRVTLVRVLQVVFLGKKPSAIMHGEPALVPEGASGTVTPEKQGPQVKDA